MHVDPSILTGLRCFESAARHLSFTRAASELNLTQSAVSQQMRQLEGRLGYPLFVRLHRNLALTDKGLVLYGCAARLLADLEQTLAKLDPHDTPLQISCLPSFAMQWLMPRLPDFQRQHPEVAVRLKAEFQTVDRSAFMTGDIDLAIRYDPDDYAADFHAEPLLDEYLLPAASPQWLAAHPGFARKAPGAGAILLHDATPWVDAPEFIEWRTWLAKAWPDWPHGLDGPQFNLSVLAITAALNGQGVALGRTALIAEEIRSGRLVDVFQEPVAAPARYVLLRRQPGERRTEIFARWLRNECAAFASLQRASFKL
ncbi:MAG: LysR substrate-binding domain-containing protein [Burkholderiaceae bacterium]